MLQAGSRCFRCCGSAAGTFVVGIIGLFRLKLWSGTSPTVRHGHGLLTCVSA